MLEMGPDPAGSQGSCDSSRRSCLVSAWCLQLQTHLIVGSQSMSIGFGVENIP